jgi:hypothetical protein
MQERVGYRRSTGSPRGDVGRGASQQYLPSLVSLCPREWSQQRKLEVAEMVLATLRGFLIGRLTSADTKGIEAGFEALARALDREERAGLDKK